MVQIIHGMGYHVLLFHVRACMLACVSWKMVILYLWYMCVSWKMVI